MGPSNATAAESRHMARVAALGCIVCRADGLLDPAAHHPAWTSPHHIVEGNRRLGHHFTIPLCHAHHQGADGFHVNPTRWQQEHGTQADLLRSTYLLLGYEPPEAVRQWLRLKLAMEAPIESDERFRLSEIAKERQCYKCRAMIGLLCLCPHCGTSN